MKRLLLLLPLLTATTANAAPVYLNCNDTTRFNTKTVESTNKPNKVTTDSELQERKIFLDININKANISRETDFVVEADPQEITLTKFYTETKPNQYGPDGERTVTTKMVINRASLSYNYSYTSRYSSTTDMLLLLRTTPSMLVRVGAPRYKYFTSKTDEKASGLCKKVEAPAANQI